MEGATWGYAHGSALLPSTFGQKHTTAYDPNRHVDEAERQSTTRCNARDRDSQRDWRTAGTDCKNRTGWASWSTCKAQIIRPCVRSRDSKIPAPRDCFATVRTRPGVSAINATFGTEATPILPPCAVHTFTNIHHDGERAQGRPWSGERSTTSYP